MTLIRDGRPLRLVVRVEGDEREYRMRLECGHVVRRSAYTGPVTRAYCEACALEDMLGEKLSPPPAKSLARRALEARGSYHA